MGNFKENINLFLTESMNNCFIKLKQIDKNYQDINAARIKASQKFEDFLDTLNSKDRQFLENYKSEGYLADSIEREWLYLQGYKDCIKLLKMIEAI
jgi:hypothetical protein